MSEGFKVVLNFEVIERGIIWQDMSKQFPQPRYIPLFVSEIIDELPLCFVGCHAEFVIELAVCSFHT